MVSPVLEKEGQHEKVDEVTLERTEDHFKSLISELTDKMDNIVAAVGAARPKAKAQPSGRAPSDVQKFGNRCLHGGSDKHRAFNCPIKKSLMEKNSGKLSPGYKSVFLTSGKRSKQHLSLIDDAMRDAEVDEFSETDLSPIWRLPNVLCNVCHAM